jgi:uncharacterized membrane protein
MLTNGLAPLLLAMLGFVGGHFVLSHPPVRTRLVAILGEKPFLGVYSLVAVAFLVWAVIAYGDAPYVEVWNLGPGARHVPRAVMPFALVLAVLGLTSKNPTAVGGERFVAAGQIAGAMTITRHPFLWGAGLWAVSHLFPNGDAASLLLFGGMAVLSFGGMAAIDHKRAVALGEAWQTIRGKTSLLPFAAAMQGRTRIDWKSIGWWRPAVGIVLYVVLLHGHAALFGASALG